MRVIVSMYTRKHLSKVCCWPSWWCLQTLIIYFRSGVLISWNVDFCIGYSRCQSILRVCADSRHGLQQNHRFRFQVSALQVAVTVSEFWQDSDRDNLYSSPLHLHVFGAVILFCTIQKCDRLCLVSCAQLIKKRLRSLYQSTFLSRSRSRSRNIYFSNTSWRNM